MREAVGHSRWPAVLAGASAASPTSLAGVKAHPLLPLPRSFPLMDWVETSARPSRQTFPGYSGQLGAQYPQATRYMLHQQVWILASSSGIEISKKLLGSALFV